MLLQVILFLSMMVLSSLKVDKVEGTEIECTVINGGDLGSKKGVNVPNVSIRLPGITEKDKEDIIFGVEQDLILSQLHL